jgi:uncharacterized protein (DUF433 family)
MSGALQLSTDEVKLSMPQSTLSGSLLLDRITIDPLICHGKPTVRGLRYTVESILEYLAGGDGFDDVLSELPDLTRDDLLACLQFATLSLKLKSQHFVAA